MTYFYKSILKSFILVLLLLSLGTSSNGQSYCNPSISNSCCNLWINDVTLDSISYTNSAAPSSPYYSYNTSMSTTLKTAYGYWVKFTPANSGYSKNMAVWIDFNRNKTFDSGEKLGESDNMSNNSDSIYFKVPNNADSGQTRMRVMFAYSQQSLTPCASLSYGESMDFVINIEYAACSSPPAAGSVITSNNSPCTGIPFILSLQSNTKGVGQTYQWQKSSDSVNWNNISGATDDTTNQYQSTSTYYRCIATCSGYSDTTAAFQVIQNAFYNCYCSSASNDGTLTNIANVTFGNFSNGVDTLPATLNTKVSAKYSDYTGVGKIGLIRGLTYPFSVTQVDANSFAVCYIKAWIDYNQNGFYENSELIYGGNTKSGAKGNTIHANITIPSSATYGVTHMRVRLEYSGSSSGSSCGNYSYGETEDYTVVLFDKMKIDAAIKSLVSPAIKSCYSANELAKVSFFNQGTDTLDFSTNNINVHVEMSNLNSGSLDTTITSGKLAPNAAMTITFGQTLDMSYTGGDYDFVVSVSLQNDSIPYNDTVRITATPTTAIPLGYKQDFDNSSFVAASYTNDGIALSSGTGLYSTDALEITMASTAKATATSELIGSTTSLSALKLYYKVAGTMSSKDTVYVQVSFDCGATFKNVYKILSNNSHASKWDSLQADLSASAGNNIVVKLVRASHAGSSYSIYIDNLAVADRPDLNFGNDTSVCDYLTLFANPNYNSWDLTWSKSKWIQDTLRVTATGTYWCRAMDALYGVWTIDTIKISVYSTPTANLGPDQKICSGVQTVLSPGTYPPGYIYTWNTGDTTATLSVSKSGTYIVKVATPGGCFASDTIKITASNQPKGVYIVKGSPFNGQYNSGTVSTPDNVCVGNTVTYEITPPTGHTNAKFGIDWNIPVSTLTTINGSAAIGAVTLTAPGAKNGSLTYTADAADADSLFMITATVHDSITGCDTTVIRYIMVNPFPAVNLGSDQTVCPNTQVYLSSSGSFSKYLWSDGSTSNMLGTTTAGNYWLKVTDSKGCINSDSIILYNYTVSPLDLGPDKSICPNNNVVLDGGKANAYLWNNNATTSTIIASTAGTYWLRVTDSNGCFSTDSIDVSLLPLPDATFNYNITNGKSAVQFNAATSTHTKYTWDYGDGTAKGTQVSPAHTYTQTGAYIVKLTVTGVNGCTDSSTQTINVNTAINMPLNLVNELNVFPNPYNHEANLNFNLVKNAKVNIELYDMYGRKLNTLANAQMAEGKHQMLITTNNTAQAVYMLRINIDGQSTVIRMVDLGNE